MSTRLPEQPFNYSERRSVGRWIRDRKYGLMLSLLILFVVCLLIKPVSYTLTHFQETDCGSLGAGLSPVNETAAKEAIQCFISAHQHCVAATLSVNDMGVDRGARETYRTANDLGNCTLSVIAYAVGCPYEIICDLIPYIDTDCRALVLREDGLHLINCGNQRDIFVST